MGEMQEQSTRVGTILHGTASGMVPMAIFTPVYAIWGAVAWPISGTVLFVLALLWSVHLARTARTLFRLGNELPHEKNEVDARITRGMTIISSVQGALILAAVVVLLATGNWVWILPAVALVVGLHFLPMPAIFGRTIDYYLGTAMLVTAVAGMVLTAHQVQWQLAWAITGTGGATVTSAYGLYMVLSARRTRRDHEAAPTPTR